NRQALDGKCNVRQVRNSAMTILKIKCVQELLGLLFVDLGQRLAHGQRGAGIFRHAIGLYLGVGPVDGVNLCARLVAGIDGSGIGVWLATGGHCAESYALWKRRATVAPVGNAKETAVPVMAHSALEEVTGTICHRVLLWTMS